jgi:hypothetical protein
MLYRAFFTYWRSPVRRFRPACVRHRVAQAVWMVDLKMMRRLVVVLGVLATLIADQCDHAIARSREVWIGQRSGGYLFLYIIEGKHMISSSKSYRVRGDQYSAAAIQVLFVKRRVPDRICASPLAKLYLHQPFDPSTKKTMKNSRRWLIDFVGRANLRRLGPLPELGMGFKTVRATDFLGRCKMKAVACNVADCGW